MVAPLRPAEWRLRQSRLIFRHVRSPARYPYPGGAVGLHRLDRPVRLTSCWGDDPPGTLVREYLHATGVPIDREESASGRTTLALAHVDDATGAATYDFLVSWDPVRLTLPPDVTLLHTGSLAIVVEPGAERVLRACREVRSRPGGAVTVVRVSTGSVAAEIRQVPVSNMGARRNGPGWPVSSAARVPARPGTCLVGRPVARRINCALPHAASARRVSVCEQDAFHIPQFGSNYNA